ncbi:MBL fold metallo-hydrolase [Haloactinopolyspora alba]|uniref:MBL fold metallo-hydrolase n=1 Tax=Haloactinopolyspora alba TaxID=648780 RepID=UPI0013EE39EA|nr:MBL fold metallo-hydrolase [Haloactinopolyspora alba]
MEILLLGTGAGDGWPNPWCRCRSCDWARATPGAARGQTSVLIDRTLLIDTGSARRAAVPLDDVRTVLFTHAHPDHADPQPLFWRQSAHAGTDRREAPLEIAGPPAALEICRPWVAPAGPVTWTPLSGGQRLRLASGHTVAAMPARHWPDDPHVGPALLYNVDDRVLAAWDTGAPLPEHDHPTYDVVLLDCTNGLGPPVDDHHDLDAFAHSVTRLRTRGAVDEHTQVVAVALGHRNPPGPELDEVLAGIGASAPLDGTVLVAGREPARSR